MPEGGSPPAHQPNGLERLFESALWSSRYLVLIPVGFALLVAAIMFIFTTVDVARLLLYVPGLFDKGDEDLAQARLELVAKVVKIVDLYLVATFMLIFAMGLYELFIGKIDAAERSEVAKRLLLVRDLDDLKDRLVKIVMLILAMLFLEHALRLRPTSHIDLLHLGGGIVLIAAALWLSQRRKD